MILGKGLRSCKDNAYACITLDLDKYVEVLELLESFPLEGPTNDGIGYLKFNQ